MTETTMEIEKQEADIPTGVERTRNVRTFVPQVDIYEIDDTVVLLADMPGVDESAIDITLEKNVLTIRGEVDLPEFDEYELTYEEYNVGDFERTFTLSDEVDRDGIEAKVKHGVLRVTLPLAEYAKKRKIPVLTE
jgi:HSP20 family molecular chaperone IbpA